VQRFLWRVDADQRRVPYFWPGLPEVGILLEPQVPDLGKQMRLVEVKSQTIRHIDRMLNACLGA
jgi:hypothetical protein